MATTMKIDGDPEGGWIGEVHDGQTFMVHRPAGGTVFEAFLNMIHMHYGEKPATAEPSNGDAPRETFGQTTTTFVQKYGVAVGVNAGFFSPVNTMPNDPRDLTGLAISQGLVVSPHTSGSEVLLITRSNAVTIAAAPPANYSNVWTAVAGSDLILVDGVVQLTNCSTSFCGPHPRTAVGVSQDSHFLYMMVIDGRQKGWSDGATLAETGAWLLRLGAWNGLNLDGGGSSAMAKSQRGAARLLNRPSGGIQRVNGNHLGVFAQPLP